MGPVALLIKRVHVETLAHMAMRDRGLGDGGGTGDKEGWRPQGMDEEEG